jgi:hypothetical protein
MFEQMRNKNKPAVGRQRSSISSQLTATAISAIGIQFWMSNPKNRELLHEPPHFL